MQEACTEGSLDVCTHSKHLKKNLAVIGVERDKKITSVYMVLCNVEYL